MATLEEVSARLTKPAKELADWNFPLSTVLEEYYTLLNEEDQVNFSNAALVLQNSATVYVRRIEYLYHDTNVLNDSFAKHDAEHAARKETKKSAKDKNPSIDFGDFETIDFTQFVGKKNNIKARVGTKTSVKLLGQRFPQLENARSSLPIDVYDVHGEVVGKKYDFRCNGYLTASGMLVDHLTPDDFLDNIAARSPGVPTEMKDSGIDLLASSQLTQSLVETDSQVDGNYSCGTGYEDPCAVHGKDTGLLDTSFASSFDSGVGSSVQSSNRRPDSSLSNYADSSFDEPLQSRPGSSLSTVDENPHVEAGISQEAAIAQARRSKRLKNVIDAVNNLNPKQWEPIPFNGAPVKSPSGKTDFKLPCPVSLIKCKSKPRKRKVITERQKKRTLENLATIENSGPAPKKMTMYSPTRQLFHPFKKEELEDFQSCFEERLKNGALDYKAVTDMSMDLLGFEPIRHNEKSDRRMLPSAESGIDRFPTTDACFEETLERPSKINVTNDEAVTNISLGSLGFMTSTSSSDPAARGIGASTSDSQENAESVDSLLDDFPMPYTPESSESSSDMPPATPPPNYHSRIEQSVRDIYENADVRTAQEEAVARWHDFMKPRLREAERRQERRPFDVKKYCEVVIEKIQKNDGKMKFTEVVENKEPTEVARFFLASLQLANKYSLSIDTSQTAEGNNNITLSLLDAGR